ncbi:MAG TPA: glycine zipper family protein, partial [Rhodopila sp.]
MQKLIVLLALTSLLISCSDLSSTQQRALTGTGIGAAGGAVLGAIGGNAALGAVAGAGAGLVGGLVVDRVKKNEASAYRSG